jgi:hypothetical protein
LRKSEEREKEKEGGQRRGSRENGKGKVMQKGTEKIAGRLEEWLIITLPLILFDITELPPYCCINTTLPLDIYAA